jgi:iron complex outermembrane receptor protein
MRGQISRALWRVAPGALLVAFAAAALPAAPLRAQQAASISGRVLSAAGEPAGDAQVSVVELRRRVSTAADGSFRIDNVPAGRVLLEVVSPRFGSATQQVVVTGGRQASVQVTLRPAVRLDEVVVTVSPEARGLAEAYQPVTVLSGRKLADRLEPTLGETLAREPGVTSSYFGPGASRPVIRGLGGDRIRVLEGGVGVGDVSNVAPEHAVMSDPLSAERIEVVRGPATLLYGSSAVGGVVNVIDRRIPDFAPRRPLAASLDLRGGTVADERSGALRLDGGLGRVAWHGGYLRRRTHDYAIPGFAEDNARDHGDGEPEDGRLGDGDHGEGEHGEEQEGAPGVLANTAADAEGGSVGLSYVAEAGYLGVAWSGYDTFYGIPDHHDEGGEESGLGTGEGEVEAAGVKIDQRARRVDLRGELARGSDLLRGFRLRLGVTDYDHAELVGEEVETRWTNDAWEGRIEALHRLRAALSGWLGVQLSRREFAAVGEDAFLPPSTTHARAVFAFEELELEEGRWMLQGGARYESQDVEGGAAGERSFGGFSSSAGVVWRPAEEYSLTLALSRAVRLPTAEELFTDGPHAARSGFVIGDPGLEEETSLGLDVSFRKPAGRLTGQADLFANRFDDFIFEELTGEERDGLRVLRYAQRDALFTGGELRAGFELVRAEPHHLTLAISADYVRAELEDSGEPLPRIPALRTGVGLTYQGPGLWGAAEVRRVDEQDRVAPLEEPTRGYTLLDATIGWRFFLGGLVHELALRGTNLSDEEARNHVSFLKEVAPLPGRDIGLSYEVSF